MSRVEAADRIEGIVGAHRHDSLHIGRAVSAEQRVYVLHSRECAARGIDLRQCEFSIALDEGIDLSLWEDYQDRPVELGIDDKCLDLVPLRTHEPSHTPEQVAAAINGATLQYVTEDDLQAALATALATSGVVATREVQLSDGMSRIDLLVGTIGIEVKIAGRSADVARQLARYAACLEISALILVTNRAAHSGMPSELGGKPVHVCSLIGGGL